MLKPYSELHFIGRGIRILQLSVQYFFREKISIQAQALTYYTLFCIVPFAALCFGIAKGFSLDKTLKSMLNANYPQHQAALNWIYQFADTTLEQAKGGIIAGVGVVLLLITVIRLAASVEDTFNTLWGLPKRRNILGKFSSYVTLMVVTPFLLIVVGSGLVVAKTLLNNFVMSCPSAWGIWLEPLLALTQIVPYLIAWIVFSGIYYGVPNTRVHISSALVGGIAAGTVFQLLQSFLIVIQTALSNYNAIYGSFAILPLFLLWMQWSWQITLYGAALAFVHQNAPDGKFELLRQHVSRRERELYLLAAVQLAAERFNAGKGAVRISEFGDALHLQPSQIRDLTDELCLAGVLLNVPAEENEDGFVPALPGPELTIQRVRDLLENAGTSGMAPADPALVRLRQQCEKLHAEACRSTANRALGEIR